MKIILLLVVCGTFVSCQSYQKPKLFHAVQASGGSTNFAYNDGNSSRTETVSSDGTIYGSYSVRDPTGLVRTIKYSAGKDGYNVLGDTGVDKVTADLARQQQQNLPTPPTNPPDYGPATNPPNYGSLTARAAQPPRQPYRRPAYNDYGYYNELEDSSQYNRQPQQQPQPVSNYNSRPAYRQPYQPAYQQPYEPLPNYNLQPAYKQPYQPAYRQREQEYREPAYRQPEQEYREPESYPTNAPANFRYSVY